jgi:hypothetical protein
LSTYITKEIDNVALEYTLPQVYMYIFMPGGARKDVEREREREKRG